MNPRRLPFLDWMKCLGMALIVFGHTGGGLERLTAPFYPKQLGVALFVFAMGYTLARDQRPIGRILYNRLFDIYLYGGLFAVLMSVVQWFRIGDLNESNYLPLVLGVNVLFDNFPANPTTWFIGTYLHLLLLGIVLARIKSIRPWMLVVAFAVEFTCRCLLISQIGSYVAYMMFSNWVTALLLGIWAGQRSAKQAPEGQKATLSPLVGVGFLAALMLTWPWTVGAMAWDNSFPFRRLPDLSSMLSVVIVSACVSALYAGYTWLGFTLTERLPDVAPIRFLARNTLLVFIAHMPLVYALSPTIYGYVPQGWGRVLVNQTVYFLGLAIVSEGVRRLIRSDLLREILARPVMGICGVAIKRRA